jgi:hypothetical protein
MVLVDRPSCLDSSVLPIPFSFRAFSSPSYEIIGFAPPIFTYFSTEVAKSKDFDVSDSKK